MDLLNTSTRKVLNLVESWMLDRASPEDWTEKYGPILNATFEDEKINAEIASNWADPDEDGRGEFVLIRKEIEQPSSNISFKAAAPPS